MRRDTRGLLHHHPIIAQLHSASGRSFKVIKDRQRVEAAVEVPGPDRLILSVESDGRYTLHASPEGEEAPTRTALAAGEMHAAEYEPD